MGRPGTKTALVALTVATGTLDVSAFLRLGGVFASVMTSNLVFVALAAVHAEAALGRHCATALVSYVMGAGAGSAAARPSGKVNRLGARRLSLLFTAEAGLLAVYAIWWVAAGARPQGWSQTSLLGAATFAMGLQSAAARDLGQPDAGTTYLTGTLTGLVAAVVTGRRPAVGAVISLFGLLAGAAMGAALLESVPDATPFLAVMGVALAAGSSWDDRWSRRA
ncbi:MAG TPA: YoaK family protein [Acidimicrobiales bacterium]|nr:YoaK family protein [Acidimicrobiales bacterium]